MSIWNDSLMPGPGPPGPWTHLPSAQSWRNPTDSPWAPARARLPTRPRLEISWSEWRLEIQLWVPVLRMWNKQPLGNVTWKSLEIQMQKILCWDANIWGMFSSRADQVTKTELGTSSRAMAESLAPKVDWLSMNYMEASWNVFNGQSHQNWWSSI